MIKFKIKINQVKRLILKREEGYAMGILRELQEKDPSNAIVWLYQGIIKRRLGETSKAIDCFKTALDLDHSLVEAWGLLTNTLVNQGDIKTAEGILEKAHLMNPHNKKIEFLRKNLIEYIKIPI